MPRETSLGFSVKEQPAISSINKIIKAFEDLNKVKETVAPNGKMKISIDARGMKSSIEVLTEIRKALNLMNKSMTRFKATSKPLADMSKVFNDATNNITKYNKTVDGAVTKTMAMFAVFEMARRSMTGMSHEFLQLTDNTFGLGVASQMTIKEIQALNKEFLNLSSVSPVSAKEMAKAVDDLVRTGKTYEESMKIIAEVSKLAVASGSSLNETARVSTKIIVSLGLKAENTSKALTALHSVAIQTASSMESLSAGFKQYAGTLGMYASVSGKAGEELDKYKQKILELGLASSGVLANLGLEGSVAGTKIKVVFSKLTALEQTATKLFNKDMSVAGIDMTADSLAKLAREDLPKAIELMSKFQKDGVLSTKTMQKMFTGRHFTEAMAIFRAINGDVEEFNRRLAQGVSYMTDYDKQMYNINNQFKVFKNNMLNGIAPAFQVTLDTLSGILMLINSTNDSLSGNLVSGIMNATTSVGMLTVGFMGIRKVLSMIIPLVGSLGLTMQMLNPITLVITGIGLAIAGIGYELRKSKMEADNFLQTLDKLRTKSSTLDMNFELLKVSIETNGEALASLGDIAKDAFSTASSESLKFLGVSNDLAVTLDNLQKMLKGGLNIDFGAEKMLKQEEESLRKQKELLFKTIDETKAKMLKSGSKTPAMKQFSEFVMGNMENLIDKEGKLSKDSVVEAFSKKMQVPEGVAKRLFSIFIQNNKELSESLGESIKQIDVLDGKLNGLKETQKANTEATSAYKTEIEKTVASSIALIEKQKIGFFKEFGKTISGETGVAGFTKILEDSLKEKYSPEVIKNILDKVTSTVKDYKIDLSDSKNLDNLMQIFGLETGVQDALKQLDDFDKEIANLTERKTVLSKPVSLGKASEEEIAEYVKIDKLLSDIIAKKATLSGNLDELIPRYIELQKALAVEAGTRTLEGGKRSTSGNYQIKYNNILKETLALEAERLKLGKTKEEQDRIAYEYRLKQYKLDLDLAKKESEFLGADLKKFGLSHIIGADPKKIQAEIDKMYSGRQGNLSGKAGSEYRDEYNALIAYGKQVTEVSNLESKLGIEVAKRQNAILEQFRNNTLEFIKLKGTEGSALKNFLGIGDTSEVDADIEITKEKIAYLMTDVTNSFAGNFATVFGQIATSEQARTIIEQETAKLSVMDKASEAYSIQLNQVDSLNQLYELLIDKEDKALQKEERKLEIIRQQAQSYIKLGDLIGNIGDKMGLKGLDKVGNIFKGIGDYKSSVAKSSASKKEYGDIFKEGQSVAQSIGKYFDSETFRDSLDTAFQGVDLGSAIGSLVGGLTGGGASSQAGGALGGLMGGLMGMSNPATMGLSLGMSLIGGMFDKKGDEEASKKYNAQQKKIYDKNTDALNKLAQNMSSLSGTVDSLNSSLISSFSKIPTFTKLTNVTDSLTSMAKTLEKTRMFENVAYQVTKTKKGKKGFMGIGATASTSWTETIEVSVQEMLKKYGFQGAIEDMTTKQLREFSKWLDDFDLGDSDNFSVLADAIEDYAEALDKMNINIDKFFYDATMESFEGISSLQQEDLRKQIEDFYKNLGFQIDDEMRKEIDKLAEQMSVMVTIMQDVRGKFIDTWRETGDSAGSAFLKSMTPYMDALMNNISQVFYDVYFSDVTEVLDKEFKALSEKLVELKKQGADMKWDDVAGQLGSSFDKVLSAIISAKQNTESFNDVLLELQKKALEAGLSLSEIFDLGLASGTQKTVLDTFKEALGGTEMDSGLTALGNMVGDKIGEAMTNKLMDSLFSEKLLNFSSELDKVLAGNMNFSALSGIMQDAMSIGLGIEEQRRRLEAIKDMFDFSQDITYDKQDSTVQYQTGVSQNVTNIYNLSSTVEVSNLVESDSVERLADSLLDTLLEKLKVDKGIDLTNR